MGGGESSRHAELAGALIEWWEDLCQLRTTSRVILVAVPPGWGRTTVLDQLVGAAGADDAPLTLLARISGRKLPPELGVQAAALRESLAGEVTRSRAAELLGLDRFGGITQIGLGVGGLFVSGLAAAVGFLLAGVAVAAAGKAWDDSPAGQDGALARTARAVAATSAQVPVIVIIDDAECLDEGLALALIENLTARSNGHVLVVAAIDPGSSLMAALTSQAWRRLTEGRVRLAEADPDMGYGPRAALAEQLCPALSDAAARRIARSTVTFKDVFAVTAAPRLAEIAACGGKDEAEVLAAVDAAASARLRRQEPSPEAVIIAWAGGLVHARQAERALAACGLPQAANDDPEVMRWQSLERVTDPASPLLASKVKDLAIRDRQAMAAALLGEALRIAVDPGCGLLERTAAAQAAHRVRGDLANRSTLPGLQRELVAGMDALGEPDTALQAAADALDALPADGDNGDRDWFAAAVLRLARQVPRAPVPSRAAELIREALDSGAVTGLEARIWAAINMLADTSQREAALAMIDRAAAELDTHSAILGEAGAQWRLLLAFHAGRAGYPALTAQILAPMLCSGDPLHEDAASVVLRASGGPNADIRLQGIILEAELGALSSDADDDRLRIYHALAGNYAALGQYGQALTNVKYELALREAIQGPDHSDTLVARHNVAQWTGESGDAAEALRLFKTLLPDMERVFGPDNIETLTTRQNIAMWTGENGDPAEALRLSEILLSDRKLVLGTGHSHTLLSRNSIALFTGACGDLRKALRLSETLLPDMEQVFGADHPRTLTVRNNIASFSDDCGYHERALRLYQALLPDMERVFGAHHPNTLAARNNVAAATGQRGDTAEALRLFQALLPDLERVLGADHPYALSIRAHIAGLIGVGGDAAEALRLYRALLSDDERVLGPDHPRTRAVRDRIAYWTDKAGRKQR